MDIRLDEVKDIFIKVIEGRISREDADRWAHSMMQLSESGELNFISRNQKEKIWSGIMYLFGVDMKISPDLYLHTLEDISEAYLQIDR